VKEYFTHFGELYLYLESLPPKEDFLHYRKNSKYHNISKKTFLRNIIYLTLAFHKKGWKDKQIGLVISPSPYWLMIDYALMFSGAVSVPLFTNISSKNLHFQIKDADIHTVFIEDKVQKEMIESVIKNIEMIYVFDKENILPPLNDLIEEGREIDKNDSALFYRLLDQIKPDDMVTIVYTSGTSGTPKGVELTHTNLISQIHATALNYHFDRNKDIAFSLLPLAHIFERMVMNFYLSQELTVYFADDIKNVGLMLKEVNPTVMTVVPRLLEKIYFKMEHKAMEGNVLKKVLVYFAFWRAKSKNPVSASTFIDRTLDRLVYVKLRQSLGSRMRMMISGGAALSDDMYRFYLNIGIPLYQGYGLTESSPVICSNTPQNNKVGTCGKVFPGVEIKIEKEELLARGSNIMRGYHHNKEETAKVIDTEGWLHTGDRASVDEEGYIRIFGRRSELFKTSTGEFVSSVYIEQALTSRGWFEHALIVGDSRPFVTALLFIEHEFLGRLAVKMHKTPLKVLDSNAFKIMTKKFIEKLNKRLNHWEKIRAYKVIPDVLSIEEGHLTPSMKLAKKQLMKHYSDEINKMYKDHR